MKHILLTISVAFLTGCSTTGMLPSVQNCQKVEYMREGAVIHVKAECTVPLGGSMIPGMG